MRVESKHSFFKNFVRHLKGSRRWTKQFVKDTSCSRNICLHGNYFDADISVKVGMPFYFDLIRSTLKLFRQFHVFAAKHHSYKGSHIQRNSLLIWRLCTHLHPWGVLLLRKHPVLHSWSEGPHCYGSPQCNLFATLAPIVARLTDNGAGESEMN